jgi:uncharacterized protein YgiM (DUF1202 family)
MKIVPDARPTAVISFSKKRGVFPVGIAIIAVLDIVLLVLAWKADLRSPEELPGLLGGLIGGSGALSTIRILIDLVLIGVGTALVVDGARLLPSILSFLAGAAAFIVGLAVIPALIPSLATHFFVVLILSAIVGSLAGAIVKGLYYLAVVATGVLVGAAGGALLASAVGIHGAGVTVLAVIGGIAGGALAIFLFTTMLILISASIGIGMLLQAGKLPGADPSWLFNAAFGSVSPVTGSAGTFLLALVLLAVAFLVQARRLELQVAVKPSAEKPPVSPAAGTGFAWLKSIRERLGGKEAAYPRVVALAALLSLLAGLTSLVLVIAGRVRGGLAVEMFYGAVADAGACFVLARILGGDTRIRRSLGAIILWAAATLAAAQALPFVVALAVLHTRFPAGFLLDAIANIALIVLVALLPGLSAGRADPESPSARPRAGAPWSVVAIVLSVILFGLLYMLTSFLNGLGSGIVAAFMTPLFLLPAALIAGLTRQPAVSRTPTAVVFRDLFGVVEIPVDGSVKIERRAKTFRRGSALVGLLLRPAMTSAATLKVPARPYPFIVDLDYYGREATRLEAMLTGGYQKTWATSGAAEAAGRPLFRAPDPDRKIEVAPAPAPASPAPTPAPIAASAAKAETIKAPEAEPAKKPAREKKARAPRKPLPRGVVLGVSIPLAVALAVGIWFLVARLGLNAAEASLATVTGRVQAAMAGVTRGEDALPSIPWNAMDKLLADQPKDADTMKSASASIRSGRMTSFWLKGERERQADAADALLASLQSLLADGTAAQGAARAGYDMAVADESAAAAKIATARETFASESEIADFQSARTTLAALRTGSVADTAARLRAQSAAPVLDGRPEALRKGLLGGLLNDIAASASALSVAENDLDHAATSLEQLGDEARDLARGNETIAGAINSVASSFLPALQQADVLASPVADLINSLDQPIVLGTSALDALDAVDPATAQSISLIYDICTGIHAARGELDGILSRTRPFLEAQARFNATGARRDLLSLGQALADLSAYYQSHRDVFSPITSKIDDAGRVVQTVADLASDPRLAVARGVLTRMCSQAGRLLDVIRSPFEMWTGAVDAVAKATDTWQHDESSYESLLASYRTVGASPASSGGASDASAPSDAAQPASAAQSAPSASSAAPAVTYRVVNVSSDDTLSLRETPSPSGALVARIPHDGTGIVRGAGVKRVGSYDWYEVSYDGHTGWVNATYLEREAPAWVLPSDASFMLGGQGVWPDFDVTIRFLSASQLEIDMSIGGKDQGRKRLAYTVSGDTVLVGSTSLLNRTEGDRMGIDENALATVYPVPKLYSDWLAAMREAAPDTTAASDRNPPPRATVTNLAGPQDSLNVRSAATAKGSIVAKLKGGDVVEILGRSDVKDDATGDGGLEYWYHVRTAAGTEGWAFGRFLKIGG